MSKVWILKKMSDRILYETLGKDLHFVVKLQEYEFLKTVRNACREDYKIAPEEIDKRISEISAEIQEIVHDNI